jgi:hypothetical protein
MSATVLILCSPNPRNCDLCLSGLVEYLGLDYKFVKPEELFASIAALTKSGEKSRISLAVSGETLETIQHDKNLNGFLEKLIGSVSFLFLYGISQETFPKDALNILTDGALRYVLSLPKEDLSYSVNDQFHDITRQFTGLIFGSVNHGVDFVFDIGKTVQNIDTIISIDNRPMFVRIKKGNCSIFALATSNIQDIQDLEAGSITTVKHFSTIVPALMFLKYVFSDSCWQPVDSQACLTIDDPLLHKKYGFLKYEALLKAMAQERFFTTMAFIPWNFRRTQASVAKLFKNNKGMFSICMHGCDHTAGEFGITDFTEISYKAKLAAKRMMMHQKLSGLGFDNIMVFPQGFFSTTSMKALKSNNYTAAVNSRVLPVDSSGGLRTIDMMRPSIMSYENFPLFHRRSPNRIGNFAFDLFLGKPALIAVHHNYFKDGYERISGLIRKINSLDANIKWRGLGEIVQKSYWLKRESDRQICLRMFSNTLHIDNNLSSAIRYSISKHETNNIPLEKVLINGEEVAYAIVNQLLKIDIVIKPQGYADVVLIYRELRTNWKEKRRLFEKTKVFLRRHLSEIRDNYISKIRII